MPNRDIFDKKNFLKELERHCPMEVSVHFYADISSTQIKAKKEADKGAREWTIIAAAKQSSGYGTRQREWLSQEGGLWFSFILRPKIEIGAVSQLSLLICLVLNQVFSRKLKIKTKIKWVNDILYKNKKLAGILVETSVLENSVKYIVCGIGINVFNKLPRYLQKTAISLGDIYKLNSKSSSENKINTTDLAVSFFKEFCNQYQIFLKEGFWIFKDRYNKSAAFMNKNIKIESGGEVFSGINEGIDEDGLLRVRIGDEVKRFSSGTAAVDGKKEKMFG